MKLGTSFLVCCEDFVSLLEDSSLVQMVTEPTRGDNVLDLFQTSNPTLVNNETVSPGIADHNIVVADVNVKPKQSKQLPQKVLLLKKANWSGLRAFIIEKKNGTINNLAKKCCGNLDSFQNSHPKRHISV